MLKIEVEKNELGGNACYGLAISSEKEQANFVELMVALNGIVSVMISECGMTLHQVIKEIKRARKGIEMQKEMVEVEENE